MTLEILLSRPAYAIADENVASMAWKRRWRGGGRIRSPVASMVLRDRRHWRESQGARRWRRERPGREQPQTDKTQKKATQVAPGVRRGGAVRRRAPVPRGAAHVRLAGRGGGVREERRRLPEQRREERREARLGVGQGRQAAGLRAPPHAVGGVAAPRTRRRRPAPGPPGAARRRDQGGWNAARPARRAGAARGARAAPR